MKILLDDGMQLGVGTGIGSYAAYLGDALAALPDTTVVRESFTARAGQRGRLRARLAYLNYLSSAAYRKRVAEFDVVHYANYAMPKRLPKGTLAAVTVHDLAAFSHKKTLPRLYGAYNRFMIRRAVKRADVIFTVSEAMRDEIASRFPRAAKKTVACYPGHYTRATASAPPATYENEALRELEKGKFFLFVGTLEKRKNLIELIMAYNLLQMTCPAARDYALVLAGRQGFGAGRIISRVLDAPKTADIRLPGYVSEGDRAKLYAEAAAFVFPTLYEGFGSPQTECMAAALPLILSDIPTNREVSGAYGTYYPVGDESALAALMKRAVQGELQPPTDPARDRLARYTWEDAATKIKNAYLAFQKTKEKR